MSTVDLILLRARASEAIERLIELLDAIDGDADFELTAPELRQGYPALGLALTDDDEPGDNGLADCGGVQEQLVIRPRLIGHRVGNYEDRPW